MVEAHHTAEGWVVRGIRRDKPPRGNARDTFDDTWRKIKEAVTLEELGQRMRIKGA